MNASMLKPVRVLVTAAMAAMALTFTAACNDPAPAPDNGGEQQEDGGEQQQDD